MKQLLIILFTITTITSNAASIKELGAIDNAFNITKEQCLQIINNAPEGRTQLEGKLIASYVDILENKLKEVEQEVDELYAVENLEDVDVEQVKADIIELQQMAEDLQ